MEVVGMVADMASSSGKGVRYGAFGGGGVTALVVEVLLGVGGFDVDRGAEMAIFDMDINVQKGDTCFKGTVPPLSTNSQLPTSPDGVDIPPSGGWRMNFLLRTSQGGISKFITWSLFFKINRFSHVVISFLFDTLLKVTCRQKTIKN